MRYYEITGIIVIAFLALNLMKHLGLFLLFYICEDVRKNFTKTRILLLHKTQKNRQRQKQTAMQKLQY